MKRFSILFALGLLSATVTKAQQDTERSFYRYTMNLVNPAYAGTSGTEFMANFRSQWQGVRLGPEAQSFFFATPVASNMCLGASVVNDRTFIEKHTGLYIDYSYTLKVAKGTFLSLGLKAGATSFSVNTGGLLVYDGGQVTYNSSDPALQDINHWNPNVGVGAYLQGNSYYVSLSIPRLLATDRVKEDNGQVTSAKDKPSFYLSGGYNLPLGTSVKFRPSTMLRYVADIPLSMTFTAGFDFGDRIELAANYMHNKGIGGYLRIHDAIDWLDLGYAYEHNTSDISNLSNGSHEIYMRFKL